MKLGATITSERGKAVTKTGNSHIDIDMLGENGTVIARVIMKSSYPYEYSIDVYPVVYPYPDKTISSSTLKLDVKGHGYKLTRKENGNLKHGCVSMVHNEDITKYGHCLECQRNK